MNTGDHIGRFLTWTARWEQGYTSSRFSYCARRVGDDLHLVQAHLSLTGWAAISQSLRIAVGEYEIGCLPFAELKTPVAEFVRKMASGSTVASSHGNFSLSGSGRLSPGVILDAPDPAASAAGLRRASLRFVSNNEELFPDRQLVEWELRSFPEPYYDLAEVFNLVGLNISHTTRLEILAIEVVQISHGSSLVDGELTVSIAMCHSLDRSKAGIGYRVVLDQAVVKRGTLRGDELEWSMGAQIFPNPHNVGLGKLTVPLRAVVQCFAIYDGVAQHQYWIADARNLPNLRRLLYEEFDPDIAVLRNALTDATERGRDARDAEGHVATLLFLLGWTVLWLRDKQLSDGPDLIAFTRNGRIAVIECTKGTLDQNDKLAKLMARAHSIKQRITTATKLPLDVLPVIVVQRRTAVIPKDDLDRARRMGIVVLAKDHLQIGIDRSIVQNDSDQLFNEALASLREAPAIGLDQTRVGKGQNS